MHSAERKVWIAATRCLGIHPVQAPLSGALQIRWDQPLHQFARERVIKYTCSECRPTSYELIGAGGAFFIRRVQYDVMAESPRYTTWNAALEIMNMLIHGRAR